MVVTIKVLCEQIERILKGTFGSNRATPTRNEIALHIRQGIGYLIKGEVFDGYKIDGQFFTNDEYNFVIRDLALTEHNDVKAVKLPVLPIDLPKGRGVIAVNPCGYLSKGVIPIQRKDLDGMIRSSRVRAAEKLVYFIEGNLIVFVAFGGAAYPAEVDATVVAAPIGGLDEELNINDSMQAKVIDYVTGVLGRGVKAQEDVNTDGINVV